jgi:hypothetical protein
MLRDTPVNEFTVLVSRFVCPETVAVLQDKKALLQTSSA